MQTYLKDNEFNFNTSLVRKISTNARKEKGVIQILMTQTEL